MKKYSLFLIALFGSITSVFYSCEDEKNIYTPENKNPTAPVGQVIDISFYTADIAGKLDLNKDVLGQSEFGLLLSKSDDVMAINSTKYPIKDFAKDYSFTLSLSGLDSVTTYYYRSYIYYGGDYYYSEINNFSTKSPLDIIKTGTLESDSCTVKTKIDSKSLLNHIQKYGISYGLTKTPNAGQDLTLTTSVVESDGQFTLRMKNIPYDTIVYYRGFVEINDQVYYGPVLSFEGNTVRTGTIDITDYTVVCHLKINERYKELGVCYGIDSFPLVSNNKVSTTVLDDSNNYKLKLNNIPFNTIIYYRAYVNTGTDIIYGNIKSFTIEKRVTEEVDLGLSVKWAVFNVGATKPEEYGDYFAWGETESKNDYSWSTYKWCKGSNLSLTKYCNESDYGNEGFSDKLTVLTPEDDVAHIKWGGDWRMPTKAEMDELNNYCTWTWYNSDNTEFNGVAGYKVTSNKEGYTDRFIFLPAAGWRNGTDLYNTYNLGFYWSSSLYVYGFSHSPYAAWYVYFDSSGQLAYNADRCNGYTVRPVCQSQEWLNDVFISLDKTSLSLGLNSKSILKAIVKHNEEDLDYEIKWSSDKPSIAIVNEEGIVTGIAIGSATISATCLGKTATCEVTVHEPNYEFVDMGLSVNWATFNVGSSSPIDNGDYFAWGETDTKDVYDWSTYKWCKGSANTMTKYWNNSDYGNEGYTDNLTVLSPEDDVAHIKWGGGWRMPTKAEMDELKNDCIWTWYENGNSDFQGVAGYKVASKKDGYTDRFIFLPATGWRDGTGLHNNGSVGFYWSSMLRTDVQVFAYSLYFVSDVVDWYNIGDRSCGYSVRPVCP